ncbi:hypothetical protein [Sorangium sp. So ce124]|uniref:hypothetical protein n=1 Tax=Sorangium sp. So ce124 TaxID=3133280 RepID=UPI003F638139
MAREGRKPKVAIFGASIAGLTAAHELIVRGFDVEVIEMARALDREGKERGPELGGGVRTQYVMADLFSDPDSWEPSIRTSTATVPPSALGWPAKGDARLSYEITIVYDAKMEGKAGEGLRLTPEQQKDVEMLADAIRSSCPSRKNDAETRANRAWYRLCVTGCHESPAPGDDEGAAELRIRVARMMSQIEADLTLAIGRKSKAEDAPNTALCAEDATDEERGAEWVHPATGINVLRCIEVGASGKPAVRLKFERAFPLPIGFDSRIKDGMLRLTEDGERSIEVVGRILDRVTVNYTRSPWVIIRIKASVAKVEVNTMRKAELGARLIEDRLRARARRVSTEPHRELLILRSTERDSAEQPESTTPLGNSAERPESTTPPGGGAAARPLGTSDMDFTVSVDVESTLPMDIQFHSKRRTLTSDGVEKIDALTAAYRIMTANHRWPRWFRWSIDPSDKTNVTLLAAFQEWLRWSRTEKGEGLPTPSKVSSTPTGGGSTGGEPGTVSDRETCSLHLLPTLLPGEHRPFVVAPYDRHIADTLRRIGLASSKAPGTSDAGVVFDNLNPLLGRGASDWGGSAARRDVQTIDLRTPAAFFARLRDDSGGFAQLVLRLLRYATTCPARREEELSSLSFWEYLEGRDNRLRIPRYRYSDAFREDLSLLCRIVTGMSADDGDARTCANIFLQVLTTSIRPTPEPYRAFNAPTTEAWLEPWGRYLRRMGVRFTQGRLVRLEPEGDEVIAYYEDIEPDGVSTGGHVRCEADYYVLATGVRTARQLTWKLDGGVPEQLSTWLDADADTALPGGRLKPLAGIQYFFVTDERAKIEPVYFCVRGFGWCLTAVTSDKLWDTPPRVAREGFTGMVSVDILAWDTPAGSGRLADRTAWHCTRRELAEEVWRRIAPHIRARLPEGAPAHRPRWYHIDDSLIYHGDEPRPAGKTKARRSAGSEPSEPIEDCDALYAMPQKGDWKKRPGALSPGRAGHDAPLRRKLVFAGAYMQTATRTATPEAANESARRAVNAILRDHLAGSRAAPLQPACGKDTVFDEMWAISGGSWHVEKRLPRSDALEAESLCKTWDPEDHEIPELAQLKRYDAWCFERRLATPWDLVGVEALPMLMSWMSGLAQPGGWARPDGGRSAPAEQAAPWAGDAIIRLIMSIREVIEARLKNEAVPPAGPSA